VKTLIQICIIQLVFIGLAHSEKTNSQEEFGGFSIDEQVFEYINKVLKEGDTILELGSGWASGELSKRFTVYSIEHDMKWVNRYDTNYIYAPIVDISTNKEDRKHEKRWYDPEIVKQNIPENYDLILIDGPPGWIGRGGFLKYIHLFKTDVPIIFDDVNRRDERLLMQDTAKLLNKSYKIHGGKKNTTSKQRYRIKRFGVING